MHKDLIYADTKFQCRIETSKINCISIKPFYYDEILNQGKQLITSSYGCNMADSFFRVGDLFTKAFSTQKFCELGHVIMGNC